MITCFYHKDCLDGFASAWVVQQRYPNARFYPVTYGELPPAFPTGEVLFVDFIYTDITVMRDIVHAAKKVTVYDHHPQAKEIIEELHQEFGGERFQGVFDANRSGAGITWDVLYPNQPRPVLVNHVEDRDLWRFALPDTREFCDGLRQVPYRFDLYSYATSPAGIEHLKKRGRIYRDELKQRCRTMLETRQVTLRLPDGDGVLELPGVFTEYPEERSELAAMFLTTVSNDVVAVLWYLDDGIRVRLVSKEKGPDVNAIAARFGGGGHPHAAGFHLTRDDERYISQRS